MEIANFLAQFWGFSFVIISLALLVKPKHTDYVAQLMDDHKNVFVFGLINVMLGVAFLLLYNVWDSSWKVIITILAWLVTIRGIACLFFSDFVKKGVERIKSQKEKLSYVFVAFILFGCFLIYLGQNF